MVFSFFQTVHDKSLSWMKTYLFLENKCVFVTIFTKKLASWCEKVISNLVCHFFPWFQSVSVCMSIFSDSSKLAFLWNFCLESGRRFGQLNATSFVCVMKSELLRALIWTNFSVSIKIKRKWTYFWHYIWLQRLPQKVPWFLQHFKMVRVSNF